MLIIIYQVFRTEKNWKKSATYHRHSNSVYDAEVQNKFGVLEISFFEQTKTQSGYKQVVMDAKTPMSAKRPEFFPLGLRSIVKRILPSSNNCNMMV